MTIIQKLKFIEISNTPLLNNWHFTLCKHCNIILTNHSINKINILIAGTKK